MPAQSITISAVLETDSSYPLSIRIPEVFLDTVALNASGALNVSESPISTINTFPVKRESPEVILDTNAAGAVYSYVIGGDVFVTDEPTTPLNTLITFTATARYPYKRYPVEYHWDFGDGTEGWGAIVTHTYTFLNPHTRITLRVTDNLGKKLFARRQVYLF